ncbi:HNH endonuclease signature motif containing protein [Kitasatospora purpeofusca]|uniref:HNH endonuclease signature motif containing protein n=1 Tax=Kitasatospora purpeofusca TaxID=67352 RepID=UPI0033E55F72
MVRDDRYGELGKRFEQYLLEGIPALKEAGYNPFAFQGMIRASGGVRTAKQLLASAGDTSYGFAKLWEKGKLDASVEFAVCLPWFKELFTDEELERAAFRLTEHRFDLSRIDDVPVPDWHAAPTPAPPAEPTYRQRVEAEEAAQRSRPATTTALTAEAVRSAVFRSLVLERAQGRCENPGCGHPGFHVIGRNGQPVVEVDHVHGLGDGGPDHPANMVVLCPNCHAVKTRAQDAEVARLKALLAGIARQQHETAMAGTSSGR